MLCLHQQELTNLSLDILHNCSINALLKTSDALYWTERSQTMTSLSDLLGLNSPRGLLSCGSTDGLDVCTPPASPQNIQDNFDDIKYRPGNTIGSSKYLQRNISLGSAGTCPSTPPLLSKGLGGISVTESCRSNSPFDQQPFLTRCRSREDTPEPTFAPTSTSPDITGLLNTLSINEAKELLSGSNGELEILNLQSLQVLQALKQLQQPSALLNSLLVNTPNAQIDTWNGGQPLLNLTSENSQLDRAARLHRSAAFVYDAVCTWSGTLPLRVEKPSGYSSKVFLGGIPWDISEQCLVQTFKPFGAIKVEWPGKDRQVTQPKGYAYIILQSEKSVVALLQASASYQNDTFYYKIGSKRMKLKDVQVIPWYLSDSNYTKAASQKLDPSKTVFVGALHGMMTAHSLAKVMDDLFGGVVYAGIDTDKFKYPIGSGRVTFNNSRSYMKAIAAAFVEIKTTKFKKKVQIDPYLEDSLCSICGLQQGPYFCRDPACFRYFCRSCWSCQHTSDMRHHNPMSRNSKNGHLVKSPGRCDF